MATSLAMYSSTVGGLACTEWKFAGDLPQRAGIPYLFEWTLLLLLISSLDRCGVYSRAATIRGRRLLCT